MTLKVEDRIYAVKDHLETASERAIEAKGLLAAGFPGFSARASYEVAYNAAAAVLLSYGLQVPHTHEGVNNSFYENFVRGEKIFLPEAAGYLSALEEDRNTDQYKHHEKKLTPEDAIKDIEKAEIFLSTARPIIEKRLEYLNLKLLSPESSEPSLEDNVRDLNLLPGNPNIYDTPSRLVNYRGVILHVDQEQGFSVQQTGNNTLVIHKHDRLPLIPEKGDNLQINYKFDGGKAEIRALRNENKNTTKNSTRQEAKALAKKLLGAEVPIVTDAMSNTTYENQIIGATDDGRYAIMRLSDNQAVIHTLALGQTPPEIGKRAALSTDANGLSTAIPRENERAQTRGVKR
jgi:uncharacterized protein (UPF0332 family)